MLDLIGFEPAPFLPVVLFALENRDEVRLVVIEIGKVDVEIRPRELSNVPLIVKNLIPTGLPASATAIFSTRLRCSPGKDNATRKRFVLAGGSI